jgi:hypothetical protein
MVSILIVIFARFDLNHYRTQIQTEMSSGGSKGRAGNLKLKLIPLHLRAESLAISEDPDVGGQSPF